MVGCVFSFPCDTSPCPLLNHRVSTAASSRSSFKFEDLKNYFLTDSQYTHKPRELGRPVTTSYGLDEWGSVPGRTFISATASRLHTEPTPTHQLIPQVPTDISP